jgi:N-acyl-phosphatidylethanolamine-hydrolysing phospholipase D
MRAPAEQASPGRPKTVARHGPRRGPCGARGGRARSDRGLTCKRSCAALLLTLTSLLGCAQVAPAPMGQTPASGFVNNYPHPPKASFWAWQWERFRDGLPKPPPQGWNLPAMKTDPALLRSAEANPSVTWIGHATVLLRIAGKNVLFDPIFSQRASPLSFVGPKRLVPLPIEVAELPKIDVVMISHNHYDHLDEDTVLQLARQASGSPRFLVPLGLKAWFNGIGIERVDEAQWWQGFEEGPLKIDFVPVQHWSRRTLTDTNATLWGGWVVHGEGLRIIHTGDTGYSKDFRDIGERFGGFDMAFIPIGAYAPRWFMQVMHVDVPEALQVRADLRAQRAIGIHWGTFEDLTDEPPDEPPLLLARQRELHGLRVDQFDVMKIGETRALR